MADIIKLLPDSVANQIAAGEVIQRPASVIKELVENAADADATEIHLIVRDAGRTLIQVTDNGCGMSAIDARMAFERHATSKIRQATDLFTLHTMGFRGEALPSICAISQVEMRTATGDDMGTKLIIEGNNVISQEACVCPKGTTIMVKNLFFNLPARRRFLKSDAVELSNIIREFERLTLVNNHIRFTLDTGSRTRDLRIGTFKQRILDLWKGSLNPEIIPVEVETDLVKISGYISRPEHARRRNPLQYLIANGRNMRKPYFHRAILGCYERLIAADTQPCYFLKFDVDPAQLDVNISPTKNEIKFEHEQQIWSVLTASVRAALGKYSAVPSIDFDTDALETAPPEPGRQYDYPASTLDPSYNPFRTSSAIRTQVMHDWNKLYDSFMHAPDGDNESDRLSNPIYSSSATSEVKSATGTSSDTLFSDTSSEIQDVRPLCLQLAGRYILAPAREGLMIIDQHRAHVKILFEKFMQRGLDTHEPLQQVMFGQELHLDQAQQTILKEVEPYLRNLGITLDHQGDTYVITSLPAILNGRDASNIVMGILDTQIMDSHTWGKAAPTQESIQSRIALTMARTGAIRYGQILTGAEMEELLSKLLRLPDPSHGPDGKKILHLAGTEDIKALF